MVNRKNDKNIQIKLFILIITKVTKKIYLWAISFLILR